MGIGGYDLVAVDGDARGLVLCTRARSKVPGKKDEDGKKVHGYKDFL